MNFHLLASPLFRPNGIVEFIRAHIETNGGEVQTDAEPSFDPGCPVNSLRCVRTMYEPIFLFTDYGLGDERRPWVHWDENILRDITSVVATLPADATIYTHCAISEAAARAVGRKTIFVQHESDVYYPESRLSYMSDHWLDQHKALMEQTTVGLTMPATPGMRYMAAVSTPYPASYTQLAKTANAGDVVAFFDSSYRKGWDRYLKWWEANGKPATTVLTHEPSPKWPAEWQTRTFAPTETAAKLQCIRNHERAFVPSRSEVTCLALLECMSQVPTLAFSDPWTEPYAAQITRVG